jgi:arylformamidase
MILSFSINNKDYNINTSEPLDISIPLNFTELQPSVYGADKASSKVCEVGSFIGDTRKGGSCNFEEYRLITHCNCTHTECVGHISFDRIFVNKILKEFLHTAYLISVTPELGNDSTETYYPAKNDNDLLITKRVIENKLKSIKENRFNALIIRTKPNEKEKKYRNYSDILPPFLSLEAIDLINTMNINHLLVDFPSVDRLFDGGYLSIHHKYWNVSHSSHEVNPMECSLKTITEMIYISDEIKDGHYLLDLNIANFSADASPSRPILYKFNSV